MEKKELSVFGGTGFVGSRFCERTEFQPFLIARESRQPLTDEVVYFISTTHNYHVFEDIHRDIDTNLSILVDVLRNLTPGKSVFNFISSWFVYGDTELPATEESICNPKGFYSITKRAAEELLVSYCQTFGINYRILRLGNVYGKGDKGVSKQKNALQFLIDRLKKGEPIDLYHGGLLYRDYMHVSDVADAIDLILRKGELDQIYNVGSGERILFKDVIDLAREYTHSTSELKEVVPPAFHRVVQVKDFYMNVDRLKSLGFAQKISLKQGVAELCQ
ncbi:NAD-dependent epimerase/dehydratase family protein [Thiovibrio sp. JS02]